MHLAIHRVSVARARAIDNSLLEWDTGTFTRGVVE